MAKSERLIILVEPTLKQALEKEAVRASTAAGKPVSVAEVTRRILQAAVGM